MFDMKMLTKKLCRKIKRILKEVFVGLDSFGKIYEHALKLIGGFGFILTVGVSILAIKEDIATRNSEYKPAIVIETDCVYEISVDWNSIDLNKPAEYDASKIKLTNVGNGNAIHVYFSVEEKEFRKWKKTLKKLNPKVDFEDLNVNEICGSCPYIVNGVENSYEMEIPIGMQKCFAEICKWQNITGEKISLPSLKFKVIYQDVQFETVEYGYKFESDINQKGAGVSTTGENSATYVINIKPVN